MTTKATGRLPETHLIAIGDVLVDVELAAEPGAGVRVHGPVRLRAGGTAVNVARAAARAGSAATVVGRIGRDGAGALVRQELADAGIADALALDDDAPTGAAVAFDSGAVVADAGASSLLRESDVPDPLEADAVLVSGYTLLQERPRAAAVAALDRARAPHVAVTAGSPRLAHEVGFAAFCGLARHATVVFANADEARALTGAEPEDAVRVLASAFAVACVTTGRDGAVLAAGQEVYRAAPTVRREAEVVGAGDAFAGLLLVALARGERYDDALRRAVDGAV